MFLLKSKPYTNYGHYDGYYTGKKYRVCRETYAIASFDYDEIKKYSSYGRAEYACNRLNSSIVNYEFYVVSEEEEKLDGTDLFC